MLSTWANDKNNRILNNIECPSLKSNVFKTNKKLKNKIGENHTKPNSSEKNIIKVFLSDSNVKEIKLSELKINFSSLPLTP